MLTRALIFSAAALCLLPPNQLSACADEFPSSPERPADQLSGRELLRWKLQAMSHIRRGSPEAAADIFAGLIDGAPNAHWIRRVLGEEAERLRLLDASTRRAIPSSLLGASPRSHPQDAEQALREQYPYVEPGELLRCVNRAEQQGRWGDALEWNRLGFGVTPASDPAFLRFFEGLLRIARQPVAASAHAIEELRQLTSYPFNRQRDVYWLQEKIQSLRSHHSSEETARLADEILSRLTTGRVHLAIRLRRRGFSSAFTTLVDEWDQWQELTSSASHELDRADLLFLIARVLLPRNASDPRGLQALNQARQVVPPSLLETAIVSELVTRLSRLENHTEDYESLVASLWERSPRFLRHVLPAVDASLDSLRAQDRGKLFSRTLDSASRLPSDHPYGSRLNELRASAELGAPAIENYQQCLAEIRPVEGLMEAPQLRATRALADLLRTSAPRTAVDHFARQLALSPPPDPYEPTTFHPYAALFQQLRQTETDFSEILPLLFLLLDDGYAIGEAQVIEVVPALLAPFDQEQDRRELRRALAARKRWAREELGQVGVALFLQQVWTQMRLLGSSARDTIRLLEQQKRVSDEDVFQVVQQLIRNDDSEAALEALRIARRKATPEGDRFSSRVPETMRKWLLSSLEEFKRDGDISLACAVLGGDPSPATRDALLSRLPSLDGYSLSTALRALCRSGEQLPESLRHHVDQELLWELLGNGRLSLVTTCYVVNPQETLNAIASFLEPNREPQLFPAAAARLASLDPSQARQFLGKLAADPQPETRARAVEVLRRVDLSLPVESRAAALRWASDDSRARVVRDTILGLDETPLEGFEVVRFLGFLDQRSAAVDAAIEKRLDLLRDREAMVQLAHWMQQRPELVRRHPFVDALRRLSGQDLPGFDRLPVGERGLLLDSILSTP